MTEETQPPQWLVDRAKALADEAGGDKCTRECIAKDIIAIAQDAGREVAFYFAGQDRTAKVEAADQYQQGIIDGQRAAKPPACTCGDPTAPGIHRTTGPCFADEDLGSDERIAALAAPAVPSDHEKLINVALGLPAEAEPVCPSCGAPSEVNGFVCVDCYYSEQRTGELSTDYVKGFADGQAALAAPAVPEPPKRHCRCEHGDESDPEYCRHCGLYKAPAEPAAQSADAVDAKTLLEHSGCGGNAQWEQISVKLNPGDKVVLLKGKITQAIDAALSQSKEGA